MAIRLMVFDVAGTTVNDEGDAVATCLRDAVDATGASTSLERANAFMGMPKPDAIRSLMTEAHGSAPSDDEVDHAHADFQERMIRFYKESPLVRPIDGVPEVFRQLRDRGIKIGLDTGFDRPIMRAILDRLGWDDTVIDDSVTSDEVEKGRPAPDMIHALMASCGLSDPGEVGKIGDSVSDIEQGIQAGCALTVAVECHRTTPVLDRYPEVRSLRNMRDLIGMVDEVNNATSGAAS